MLYMFQAVPLPIISLLAATASSSSKQAWHTPDAVCTVLELLMTGGETVGNM